jgi:hypothetical protein
LGGARRSDAEFIGRLLREALTALADLWVPHGRPKMRATRKPDDTPRPPTPDRVKRGRVVHATRHRVFDV